MGEALEFLYIVLFALYGWARVSKLVTTLHNDNSPLLLLIPYLCMGYAFLEILLGSLAAKLTTIIFNFIGGNP